MCQRRSYLRFTVALLSRAHPGYCIQPALVELFTRCLFHGGRKTALAAPELLDLLQRVVPTEPQPGAQQPLGKTLALSILNGAQPPQADAKNTLTIDTTNMGTADVVKQTL